MRLEASMLGSAALKHHDSQDNLQIQCSKHWDLEADGSIQVLSSLTDVASH